MGKTLFLLAFILTFLISASAVVNPSLYYNGDEQNQPSSSNPNDPQNSTAQDETQKNQSDPTDKPQQKSEAINILSTNPDKAIKNGSDYTSLLNGLISHNKNSGSR